MYLCNMRVNLILDKEEPGYSYDKSLKHLSVVASSVENAIFKTRTHFLNQTIFGRKYNEKRVDTFATGVDIIGAHMVQKVDVL